MLVKDVDPDRHYQQQHLIAKRGFVLLPRRRVMIRNFAWAARFRRLARDYERLDVTLKGVHLLAFATLMHRKLANTLNQTS
jgi:transposase